MRERSRPSVVVVGGGHGCARALTALRRLEVARTAVVSVADDGGSSGRLRRDHGVVALGDLRMALLALAAEEGGLATLAQHRFSRGELDGHSVGNLLLLGLLEQHSGDLLAALDAFGGLIGAEGRVLPATTSGVTLLAETAAGPVAGQAAVSTATRIRRVRLAPADAPAAPGVVDAIMGAALVLLGPGSLYTSILPDLLLPDVTAALVATDARVALVGNLREQPGETEGMDLADHVEALLDHAPGLRIDVLLAHERGPDRDRDRGRTPGEGAGGRRPLAIDDGRLVGRVGRVLRRDLGDERDGHDASRLADAVVELLAGERHG